MLKKAAALLLVCASMVAWVGCGTTTNKFLYAAIPASNEIVIFREDPNSGALTQLVGSPITAGQAVQSLVLHPTKKFLYAANSGATPTGTVSQFDIASSGALTEQTPRYNVGTAPTLLAIDPSGSYLYVGNSGSFDISVLSIDSSSGNLTPIPQSGGGATAPIGMSPLNMQLSPSGNTLFVTGQAVVGQGTIEAFPVSNGILGTPVVSATGNTPYGLAIDSSGTHLYTGNKIDNSVSAFTINSDNSLTLISTTGETFTGPVALFIDKSGKYLYVANSQSSGNLAAFSIGSDGDLTLLANSPFATGSQPNFITGDSAGKYLFVGNQSTPVVQSFSLDDSTGTLTSVSSYSVPGTPTSIVITP
ncbi:MAG TPA: beta-propeller fold lactonase family protein [Candidatus Eisenbacteria bacterium]|nr:beta-propeller fold lactonase family protein [Candidatus Eisenbacteria bacterium]